MTIEPRSIVVISRQWHSPEITAMVNNKAIALTMSLDDFLAALKAELSATEPDTFLSRFTSKQARSASLAERIETAALKIVHEMKSASRHIV